MTARSFPGRITRWVDADTCRVDIDLGFYSWLHDKELRLAGYDAAEIRNYVAHPKVEKAVGLYTKALVEEFFPVGSEVTIYSHHQKHGKYGRIIGDFYCDEQMQDWGAFLVERNLVVPESIPQIKKNAAWKVMHERLVREGKIGG